LIAAAVVLFLLTQTGCGGSSEREAAQEPEQISDGVKLTGKEPLYNPELWDGRDYIDFNNCYAYAVNNPVPKPTRELRPDPGYKAGLGAVPNIDEYKITLQVRAKADGLIYLHDPFRFLRYQ